MIIGAETVSVIRPTESTDRYGNTARTYSTADHTITGCAAEPTSTSEVNDGRTSVTDGINLYMPAGSDLLPSDRVTLRGATYEVQGEPAVWSNPLTPDVAGIVATLRRVAG